MTTLGVAVKLALFDDHRLGVVIDDERIVDVTTAITSHESDASTAGWWRRLCRDWPELSGRIADAAHSRESVPLDSVTLQAPVLNPSKVIAAASNYREHVAEMHDVQERTLGAVHSWMMEFDVFLKAPSSITAPAGPIVLPPDVLEAGHEIHHESELVVIIGTGGKDIPVERANEHIFGYSVGLDITVRSPADRSRRKSYDTFSPIGPWIRVADDDFDAAALDILLTVDGSVRQKVNTADLIMSVPQIVSYASRIMTLNPGDVIFTGAPPGVGPIAAGETLITSISGIGTMETVVR
jgi:2-keto-4-pentenoate hydratase/2-oxohepta-3-ene-1,7-dioic acid hydratase in catechol pathway